MQSSPSQNEQQIKLLRYLDEFDKQMSSRRSAPSGLEEQLASLSRAYNQAQQKLLDTERALMAESILLEKQRSVIDIYKCALNEELDQQGLLYFLQRLEEDQSNRQIYDEIAQVRGIVAKRRVRRGEEERSGNLRRELARITEENSLMAENNQIMNSSCLQAQDLCRQLQEELQDVRKENEEKDRDLKKALEMLEEQRKNVAKLKEQIAANDRYIDELSSKQKEMQRDRQRLQSIERVLKERLNLCIQKSKENTQSHNSSHKTEINIVDLQGKLSQLVKYRSQYKKAKQQHLDTDFLKKEVTLLKLFLSEEALNLFREFQLSRQECIEGEIRNLALLQRSRMIKLQQCEKSVWKYRIQLMLEEDGEKIGKDSHTLKSTLYQTSSHAAGMTHSYPHPISQFSS